MKNQSEVFFQTVMKLGGLFSSEHISCKIFKGKSITSEARVIVSKKVSKSAVVRNRLKRQVRGVFKRANPSSVWVVFYVKKGADKLSVKQLSEEVAILINKI